MDLSCYPFASNNNTNDDNNNNNEIILFIWIHDIILSKSGSITLGEHSSWKKSCSCSSVTVHRWQSGFNHQWWLPGTHSQRDGVISNEKPSNGYWWSKVLIHRAFEPTIINKNSWIGWVESLWFMLAMSLSLLATCPLVGYLVFHSIIINHLLNLSIVGCTSSCY